MRPAHLPSAPTSVVEDPPVPHPDSYLVRGIPIAPIMQRRDERETGEKRVGERVVLIGGGVLESFPCSNQSPYPPIEEKEEDKTSSATNTTHDCPSNSPVEKARSLIRAMSAEREREEPPVQVGGSFGSFPSGPIVSPTQSLSEVCRPRQRARPSGRRRHSLMPMGSGSLMAQASLSHRQRLTVPIPPCGAVSMGDMPQPTRAPHPPPRWRRHSLMPCPASIDMMAQSTDAYTDLESVIDSTIEEEEDTPQLVPHPPPARQRRHSLMPTPGRSLIEGQKECSKGERASRPRRHRHGVVALTTAMSQSQRDVVHAERERLLQVAADSSEWLV
ncbi:hypothetical protein KIPB_000092 [Kipferlia bialata]|uniref:Uncharacterized protein n=1 Tax=Kipferlia bialata TaxID=797122 RepID=A0A391NTF9_9EUKA|nr:hypothetical protein KIPB_000092 [Kipferlia bialata]|eukprot:g92.t1